ncbi:NXPE family member 3-like [Cheilinus undulatus]|uniref:NXPE family member 3-like n=1 Tax=Cheilinus undulatus TaxID=241271 RepID=UPI001BD2E2F0|nr:NXPE family member 3-like [Cheilinus undulatus]
MKLQCFTKYRVSKKLLKGCAILLFLCVLVFLLQNNDLLQEHCKEISIILKKVNAASSSGHPIPHDLCTFKPLSPADAKEERLLLDSIAWPETPLVPLSLIQMSDSAHSSFTILPGRDGREWHVGDQLEVMIQMRDFKGNPKKYGGDFLIAQLNNWKLDAGVAGRVVDHLNGSYSAFFTLPWQGRARVEVTLVHPSEAVTVLHRLSREQPYRVFFKSIFRSGSISESTICNVCLRQTNQTLCNFTDLRTGEPWFCYKPEKLSCDARVSHSSAGFKKTLTDDEERLFQKNVNMKVSIPASGLFSVVVLPQRKGQLKVNQRSRKSEPSGYYYKGAWRSLDGTKVHQFSNASAISDCLRDKKVHLYGDSTIRQWFEYLDVLLPDAKKVNVSSVKRTGPFMMWDDEKKILVTYRCHGPPLSSYYVSASQLHYIANELDELVGGTDTVVAFDIWAHFCPFPMELYIRRLQSIRRAVIRLLNRAPGTLVVIRTANLREMTPYVALIGSDWFSFQRDKVLRAAFKGLNVRMVDAWEMTLAHQLPHRFHPQPPIVGNMINVFLSYICPP